MNVRGFTAAEVEQAVREAPWRPARKGRLESRLNFAYNAMWHGRLYATKQVRVIFVEEPQEVAVVTVITYYF